MENFIFTFSPVLRLAYNGAMSPETQEIARQHLIDTAKELIENREVAESLKVPSLYGVQTRQIDVKTGERGDPNTKILFKCFASWAADQNCFVFRTEMGNETYWEEKMSKGPTHESN